MMKLDALVEKIAQPLLSQTRARPLVFGVSGGQGVGKSTFCAALETYVQAAGRRALTLALDDFYLPKAARQALAQSVHPLCKTRGVPGTHDVARLQQTLTRLLAGDLSLPLPVFSKSHDDVLPPEQWRRIEAQPDIILLEGWCVGARGSFLSPHPQTEWELAQDSDGVWKQWSQTQASAYEAIWAACDGLMLMRQDDFASVIDSRWAQEQDNAAASGLWQFESRAQVAEFCAHYESWTLGLWQALPPLCDFVIGRDTDFTYRWLD